MFTARLCSPRVVDSLEGKAGGCYSARSSGDSGGFEADRMFWE